MKRRATIVIAGEFWSGSCARGLADGFRDMGWAVQEVSRPNDGTGLGGLLARAVARVTRPASEAAYRAMILRDCEMVKPDVFLTVKGPSLTSELLRSIRDRGARAVMFYPDVVFQHPGVREDSFDQYDLFVTTKSFQLPYLEARLGAGRVAHIHHGYCPGVHRPVFDHMTEADYACDVVHVGNRSAYKQDWLERLLGLDADLDLRIVGARWTEQSQSVGLARATLAPPRIGVAYAREIQSARINIALHMGPVASGWADLVSTRTFEIPACRGFMLHIDSPEVRSLFEPGVEIDVFSSVEELRDKIDFYLARPELRARMIELAYARCVPAYGYGARAEAIEALMRERQFVSMNPAGDDLAGSAAIVEKEDAR